MTDCNNSLSTGTLLKRAKF